jgi:hypothetical protein
VLGIAVEAFDQGAVRLALHHSSASLPLVSRKIKLNERSRDSPGLATIAKPCAERPELGPPVAI